MIGVVVPAHDEEALVGRCLRALQQAAGHPAVDGEEVVILVVLDSCRDATEAIARALDVECVAVEAHNVGIARSVGAEALIARGARWLAFTDADTAVTPSWLADQLVLGADAVCGVVTVEDWSSYSPEERHAYEMEYTDADGHPHVHGANLGVSSETYRRAGGFRPLCSAEDVELVERLEALGVNIVRTNTVRVHTSSRRIGRAPAGFAHYLMQLPAITAGTLGNLRSHGAPVRQS